MKKGIFNSLLFVSTTMIASTSFVVKSLINIGGILTATEINSSKLVKLDHQEEFEVNAPINHLVFTIDQNGIPSVTSTPICTIQGTIVAVDLENNPPAPLSTLSCNGLLNGSNVTAELQPSVAYFRDGTTNKRVKSFYHFLVIKNTSGAVIGSLDSQSQSDLFKLNINKMIKTSIINLAIVPNGGFDGIESRITFDKN